MSSDDTTISKDHPRDDGEQPSADETGGRSDPRSADDKPREIGGRKGPDPTRFGDWEKGGRCIDF